MTANRLKVIILTQDEPFYIPRYINNIFQKLGNEIDVIKVYALPPNLSKKGVLHTVKDFYAYFGFVVFTYMVAMRIFYMLSDLINQYCKNNDRYHAVHLVCRKYGISFSKVDKINSKAVLNEFRNSEPDIILSVACPQIIGAELISVPSKGCLNIHSSLLPLYRGLNANFWVLAKGEEVTGATIHYINPGIDDGDILLQEEINIDDDWSLNDLYLKVIDVGSGMIAKCLKNIHEDKVVTSKNDISKGSYYTFPTKEDVKEFRSRNKRFFKYY